MHGIKAPAFIPAKAKHMIRDCKLIAERNNVKFKFNSYFPIRSLNLMRGVFVAEEDNFKIGKYELVFFVGEYFQKKLELQTPKFLDEVVVRFGVSNVEENYHIPLLVSPWSYSTYRGS